MDRSTEKEVCSGVQEIKEDEIEDELKMRRLSDVVKRVLGMFFNGND